MYQPEKGHRVHVTRVHPNGRIGHIFGIIRKAHGEFGFTISDEQNGHHMHLATSEFVAAAGIIQTIERA